MAKETFEELIHARFNQSVEIVLHDLAKKGYTRQTAAEHLDCSQSTITVYAQKLGIPFKSLSPQERSKAKIPKPIDQLQVQINHTLSKKWV